MTLKLYESMNMVNKKWIILGLFIALSIKAEIVDLETAMAQHGLTIPDVTLNYVTQDGKVIVYIGALSNPTVKALRSIAKQYRNLYIILADAIRYPDLKTMSQYPELHFHANGKEITAVHGNQTVSQIKAIIDKIYG